ncbi:MAG: NAD(P)H-dependent oxidoreductase [Parasporobacterium sp.]|nr:NAD(P)H-dependent oxidoreductase [Parasporobacterium sp.]
MILYINSCVRENSRTDKIARALLEKLGGEYTELYLPDEKMAPLSRESLNRRMEYIENGQLDAEDFKYARQFAEADTIIISAPFWDLGFPAILKTYLENIYVIGVTSDYTEEGHPHGLCKAEKLYYVTTAGGPYFQMYSFDYIKSLAEVCFGIKDTELIFAQMLDIDGTDADKAVDEVIENIKNS